MSKSGFDMERVRNFKRLVRAGSSGPLRPVFKQWGIRYLAWIRRLFYIKSRGGTVEGVTWKALSPVTIRNRRSRRVRGAKGQKSRYAILVDRLGTIPKAMVPFQSGNIFKYIEGGVRVGFGGSASHPDGRATIANIARWHNIGAGRRLPKRQILHMPNTTLTGKMMNDLKRGIDRIGNRT